MIENYKEKVFEVVKAIAPVFINRAMDLKQSIIDNGKDPKDYKIGDKTVDDSFVEYMIAWAEKIVISL